MTKTVELAHDLILAIKHNNQYSARSKAKELIKHLEYKAKYNGWQLMSNEPKSSEELLVVCEGGAYHFAQLRHGREHEPDKDKYCWRTREGMCVAPVVWRYKADLTDHIKETLL